MQAHCHQTTSQPKNDLPACVIISSKTLCADDAAFNHPFSLSPVMGSCLTVLMPLLLSGNIHSLFSITWYGSVSAAFVQSNQTTSQFQKIWPKSYRSITIMQNVSLRTAGRTHAGPSPLGNKTVRGQPVALIQAQQSNNYLPACVIISSKTLCADDSVFKPTLFSIFC